MSARRREIFIKTGEFHFTCEPIRIRTVLGSCVAFTAWHPVRHIGGMCHYLLPAASTGEVAVGKQVGLYAEQAAQLFQNAFTSVGTQMNEYVVKMFGGGSMFPSSGVCREIPNRNVTQGRSIFESRGFAIAAQDVGGTGSRQLIFDVWTGDVWVRRSKSTAALRD